MSKNLNISTYVNFKKVLEIRNKLNHHDTIIDTDTESEKSYDSSTDTESSSDSSSESESSIELCEEIDGIFHNFGNVEFTSGNYQAALDFYQKINKKYEKIHVINSNIAACYLLLCQYDQALFFGLNSVEKNLNYATGWGRVGSACKGLKNNGKAYSAFKIAYKINPNNQKYLDELNKFEKNIKINKTDIFNLFMQNKNLLQKLKDKNFISMIFTSVNPLGLLLGNNDMKNIIDEVILKLDLN
jgi:tetratricopeptide (TPR) repeat protein